MKKFSRLLFSFNYHWNKFLLLSFHHLLEELSHLPSIFFLQSVPKKWKIWAVLANLSLEPVVCLKSIPGFSIWFCLPLRHIDRFIAKYLQVQVFFLISCNLDLRIIYDCCLLTIINKKKIDKIWNCIRVSFLGLFRGLRNFYR